MYGSYYKRAATRAFQETAGFAKRKVVFGCSMGIGIAVALALFGAAHLTIHALLTNLSLIVSCYAIAVMLCFIWNLAIAAPVFLDNQLSTELAAMRAEKKRDDRAAIQTRFASLLKAGRSLYDELNNVQGQTLHIWDAALGDWQESVRLALEEIGFPADFQEFMRVINDAEPLGGVVNLGWKQENRRRRLVKQQQKLEEIVLRRH